MTAHYARQIHLVYARQPPITVVFPQTLLSLHSATILQVVWLVSATENK